MKYGGGATGSGGDDAIYTQHSGMSRAAGRSGRGGTRATPVGSGDGETLATTARGEAMAMDGAGRFTEARLPRRRWDQPRRVLTAGLQARPAARSARHGGSVGGSRQPDPTACRRQGGFLASHEAAGRWRHGGGCPG
ncbi:hypothetical protein ZWY2020_003267 [Hordeum vulgare]|nr:hypothetical protein ZWY2020_003267 [Hordeum vulgare]